jgi:hypothetical protein
MIAVVSQEPSEPAPPEPKQPAEKRREWHPLRLAAVAAVIAAIVLAVLYRRASVQRQAQLRIQQACLRYEPPATQVVYEELPTRAADLLAKGGEYISIIAADGPPIAGHVPQAWRDMRKWAMPRETTPPKNAVLFLHERQTYHGTRGLICIEADRAARELRVTFIHPGGSTLDPVPITNVAVVPRPQEGLVQLTPAGDPFADRLPPQSEPPTARANLRFFAGVADAQDLTHLTLAYERDDQRGVIDLWVADERTVHFTHHRQTP